MNSDESIFDKLKSMGVRLGAQHISPPAKPAYNSYPIESVVDGFDIQTIYGKTFAAEHHYPLYYSHGIIPLCSECASNGAMEILARWCAAPRITNPGGQNIVFIDTETSGLAGGTGTYVFLIGIGYRTAAEFIVEQYFMRDPAQEAGLLAALDQKLAQFDTVVTFNGKTFDIPLLNTRYMLNGFTAPFGSYDHVDVLQVARKLWRDRLSSRSLSDLEKEIIKFNRTLDDIPGWMIPQIYFDYLRSGDARPLAGVFYHNVMDILSLAALFGRVGGMLQDPLHNADEHGLDLAAIARLYEELGMLEESAELYEQSLSHGDLPEPFFLKVMERYALLRRRQKNWEKAVQLWEKAAAHGDPNACIELSKYYEHRERNYFEALEWARKALDSLEFSEQNVFTLKAMERDIQRRIGRLYQKVYKQHVQ